MFFVNVPAPTEIYTLSLHDALPISTPQPEEATTCIPTRPWHCGDPPEHSSGTFSSRRRTITTGTRDRKSTRLNSSHTVISYAVFCLKKKKKQKTKHNSQGVNSDTDR